MMTNWIPALRQRRHADCQNAPSLARNPVLV